MSGHLTWEELFFGDYSLTCYSFSSHTFTDVFIDTLRRQHRGWSLLEMLISNLLLDFLQRFLETSAGGYRENSSNPMISKAYQATNGMSIVVEGGRLYSILRFQTFFPSINWNSVLDSDFDGGGWIYAAAPALPSADAINKPNVTLQQWQLAAVFHWEAPFPLPLLPPLQHEGFRSLGISAKYFLALPEKCVSCSGGEANCILIHWGVRGSKYRIQVLTWTPQNLTFACMFIFQTLWFRED